MSERAIKNSILLLATIFILGLVAPLFARDAGTPENAKAETEQAIEFDASLHVHGMNTGVA